MDLKGEFMFVYEFINNESEYIGWIGSNKKGYVLNTTRQKSPKLMALHHANCRLISQYNDMAKEGGFTERNYIKVCSNSISDLRVWVARHGRADGSFTLECSMCKVNLVAERVKFDPLRKMDIDTEESVLESKSLTLAERRDKLNQSSKYPERMEITTTAFKRNPDVIAEVLLGANGICQSCKNSAPFNRSSDGSPYLEIHHVLPLSEGGEDTVSNALALCPNCHREKHFG